MSSEIAIARSKDRLVISIPKRFKIENYREIFNLLNRGIFEKPIEIAYFIFIGSIYLMLFGSVWLTARAPIMD